jgi:hypothetical protein
VTLLAVAAPLVRGKDDFPLSNYPMFSRARARVERFYHVVGFSNRGDHRPVEPSMVGTDEIMQAHQTVKLAIRRGPQAAQSLCEAAAERVAEERDYDDLDFLEVRVDWFDTWVYWEGDRRPRNTNVAARCPIAREGRG